MNYSVPFLQNKLLFYYRFCTHEVFGHNLNIYIVATFVTLVSLPTLHKQYVSM